MAAMLNQVTIVGKVIRDPKVINFDNGQRVLNLTIVNERDYFTKSVSNASKDNRKRSYTYIRTTFWGSRADAVANSFRAGDLVYLCGELSSRTEEAPNGRKRDFLYVNNPEIYLVNSRETRQEQYSRRNEASDDEAIADENGEEEENQKPTKPLFGRRRGKAKTEEE